MKRQYTVSVYRFVRTESIKTTTSSRVRLWSRARPHHNPDTAPQNITKKSKVQRVAPNHTCTLSSERRRIYFRQNSYQTRTSDEYRRHRPAARRCRVLVVPRREPSLQQDRWRYTRSHHLNDLQRVSTRRSIRNYFRGSRFISALKCHHSIRSNCNT